MLEGLEVSEVRTSELEYSKRLDAEYYAPKYLKYENIISSKGGKPLSTVSDFLIGPFGSAFTVENYTDDKTYRYIRGKDVKPMALMNDDSVYMPKEDYDRLSKYALKKEDILVSVVGTLGNAAIVEAENLPAIFSCKSTVLRTKDVNPRYLLTYLNSKYGRDLLLRKERGAIQKGLNLDDLKTLEVYISSNEFQNKISEIYEQSKKYLKKSKSLYTQAEQLLLEELGLKDWQPSTENINSKSFKESFGATGRLDAEYYQPKYEEIDAKIKQQPFDIVENICSHINYGTVPTSPYTDDGTGVPYIKGMNLKNLEITKNLDRITNFEGLPDKAYVKKGDIIISQMGTVGDVGVITEEENGYTFASFTIRIRLKDTGKFNPFYVGLYIQNIAKQWYLYRNIAQASVRQNTDLPTIKNMYIPILNYNKQKAIAQFVEQSFVLKHQSEHLLEVAKRAVEIAIEEDEEKAIEYINKSHNLYESEI